MLDGFWDFQTDPAGIGEANGWTKGLPEPEPMAVPASFNELTARPELRDYLGDVWYLRRFFVPRSWDGRRIWLRFGSVHYRAVVWINGHKLLEHEGGHLPFAEEVTTHLRPGEENVVAVRVNNVLDWTTIPPGYIEPLADSDLVALRYRFDFFNYAGIHRSVWLYTTGDTYLADLGVRTSIEAGKARVTYALDVRGAPANKCRVSILDAAGKIVTALETNATEGEFVLDTFMLWGPGHPYLYKLRVELLDERGHAADVYTDEFGIRTIELRGNHLLLNGERIYLKGCARHEDFFLTGRGQNPAVTQKDFNLLKWLGANSFRTSHYPYAEETMRLADRLGFLVIDEVPAVGMTSPDGKPVFTPERINERALATHCRMVRELYQRDKNHPSVIAWSIGNEAATNDPGAVGHFEKVTETIKSLDSTRPVTLVMYQSKSVDTCCGLVDFICVNRYYSWYSEPGRLERAGAKLKASLLRWHKRYGKPVMLSEFGADTIAGLHSLPSQMFTEEYQLDLIRIFCETLDDEELDFVLGEHVWVLADYLTAQGITRVVGNRKGVFTRDRQPKMVAQYLRCRGTGHMTQVNVLTRSGLIAHNNDCNNRQMIRVNLKSCYLVYQPSLLKSGLIVDFKSSEVCTMKPILKKDFNIPPLPAGPERPGSLWPSR